MKKQQCFFAPNSFGNTQVKYKYINKYKPISKSNIKLACVLDSMFLNIIPTIKLFFYKIDIIEKLKAASGKSAIK